MKLGIVSRSSLSRKGLSAMLASEAGHSVVLDLPSLPDDFEIITKAQTELLLYHPCGEDSDLEKISRLRTLVPKVKILLFLDAADDDTEFRAIRAGCCGCIPRDCDLDVILKAIEVMGRGEIWVNQRVATRFITKLVQSETTDKMSSSGLTRREWEILTMLARGSRNKEIAILLSVSENTVKTHLNTIYRKLDVDCRLAATLYYFRQTKLGGEPLFKAVEPVLKTAVD